MLILGVLKGAAATSKCVTWKNKTDRENLIGKRLQVVSSGLIHRKILNIFRDAVFGRGFEPDISGLRSSDF